MDEIEDRMESDTEISSLKLKEYFPEIVDLLEKAFEIVKELYRLLQGKINPDKVRQSIVKILMLASDTASEKEQYTGFVELALETLDLELKQLNRLNNDDAMIQAQPVSAKTEENLEDIERKVSNLCGKLGNDKEVQDLIALDREEKNSLEDVSVDSIWEHDLTENPQNKTSYTFEVINSQIYDKETKAPEKKYTHKPSSLGVKYIDLKTGNFTNEKLIKTLEPVAEFWYRRYIDIQNTRIKDGKHFYDMEDNINVNFRLADIRSDGKQDIYATFHSIFRNNPGNYSAGDGLIRNEHKFTDPFHTMMNGGRQLNNPGDILMMPDDIKGSQEQLGELIQFLSMARNNSFDVDLPHGLRPSPEGERGLHDLTVDITVKPVSGKPWKRRFTLRMHVVSSDAFENAMRDCHIHSLELTYTNIFPSNCRMFIGLPIYRDSYLDRKDRIDRQ